MALNLSYVSIEYLISIAVQFCPLWNSILVLSFGKRVSINSCYIPVVVRLAKHCEFLLSVFNDCKDHLLTYEHPLLCPLTYYISSNIIIL